MTACRVIRCGPMGATDEDWKTPSADEALPPRNFLFLLWGSVAALFVHAREERDPSVDEWLAHVAPSLVANACANHRRTDRTESASASMDVASDSPPT